MLGPGEKAQGRASYDGFWRGIRPSPSPASDPVAGSDSVDVTLTYRRRERADIDRAQAVRPDQVEQWRLPHQRRAPGRLTRAAHGRLRTASSAPAALAHRDRDVAVTVGALDPACRRGAAAGASTAPGARSRCPPHRHDRQPGTEAGEQLGVLVAAAVVRHLQHVHLQTRQRARAGVAAPPAPCRRSSGRACRASSTSSTRLALLATEPSSPCRCPRSVARHRSDDLPGQRAHAADLAVAPGPGPAPGRPRPTCAPLGRRRPGPRWRSRPPHRRDGRRAPPAGRRRGRRGSA